MAGFFVARFFLGVTESGLFPGVVYYFSMWLVSISQKLKDDIVLTRTSSGISVARDSSASPSSSALPLLPVLSAVSWHGELDT